jgi:hypothetical protein
MSRNNAALVVAVAAVLCGCRSFETLPLDEVGFQDRIQTTTRDDVTVSVAVLSAEEAKAAFGVKLYKKRIQPIWIEIENRRDEPLFFLPRGVDPAYVPPLEAAYRSHWTWHRKANRQMDRHFYENELQLDIPAGETRSGFVLASRDRGARLVVVDLLAEGWVDRFEFTVDVPGFRADYHKAIEKYGDLPDSVEVVDLDAEGLRDWLESQPCCTTNAKGTKNGDPLNLVVIGTDEAVWPALLRAGWDPTETMRGGTAVKTGLFGIFGGRYRYAPISSLYVFGRPQDIAFQKARHNIHLRNHLRLWWAPVTFEGKPVWIGQISRDIGSRFTTKSSTLTTHKIDPDVDETRAALAQDFIYTESLAAVGTVGGVGAAPADAPRGNLTGDPYFTDGRRIVLVLSEERTPALDIAVYEWEPAPGGDGNDDSRKER